MGPLPGENQAAGPPELTAEALAMRQAAARVLAGIVLQSVDAADGPAAAGEWHGVIPRPLVPV